jgi:4-amino-4-deoxy-L-arabinose transferase-like glycosyltransferase
MSRHLLLKDYGLLWCILVAVGLVCRPLTAVDETRAVSVAWEMWQRGDWLVPHLNGEPYSHKPPLLQWAIQASWLVFGVNDWTPRLVAPLFGLANLVLVARLAGCLWPGRERIARIAPLMLLGLPIWALWTTLTLYDMLMTFFTTLGVAGIWRAARGETSRGWLMTAAALGGGILAKGPVSLLLVLPLALAAPGWTERPERGWRSWYAGVLGAVLLGAAIALLWAVPAGISGGDEYRRAIFWSQSAGRIAHSFAHQRPWWWYAAVFPLLLMPWIFWGRPRRMQLDAGLRFCLVHVAATLVLLSVVSGKQVHYLLPLVPTSVLVLARLLDDGPAERRWPGLQAVGAFGLVLGLALIGYPWLKAVFGLAESHTNLMRLIGGASLPVKAILVGAGVFGLLARPAGVVAAVRAAAFVMAGVVVALHLMYREAERPYQDLGPIAGRLAELQGRGVPVGYWGKYSGDFQFLGRLKAPLQVVDGGLELTKWLMSHPDGCLVIVNRHVPETLESRAEFAQSYRGSRRIGVWKASALLGDAELLRNLIR